MTKATKATAAETTAETAAETAAADMTAAVAKTTETATNAIKGATSLFGALTLSARKAIEGVVEVDKALFGYAKEGVSEFYTLGRESMNAKCLNDLIDLQASFAHARIEATAANAREVVDLSRAKAKEAYAPVKDVIGGMMPGKAA